LTRYWRDHPPGHLLLAAKMGLKPPAGPKGRSRNIEELLAVFGQLGGTVVKK
jgi:hypothetical protein